MTKPLVTVYSVNIEIKVIKIETAKNPLKNKIDPRTNGMDPQKGYHKFKVYHT
jgi:hypothetical protein